MAIYLCIPYQILLVDDRLADSSRKAEYSENITKLRKAVWTTSKNYCMYIPHVFKPLFLFNILANVTLPEINFIDLLRVFLLFLNNF